jgi:hypothetical protein
MKRTYLLITVLSMVLGSFSACKCNKDAAQMEEMNEQGAGEPAPEAAPAPVEVAPAAPAEAAPAPAEENK